MRGTISTGLSITPGGVREDINPPNIPEGWLLGSNNWLTLKGRGRARPGYVQIDAAVASGNTIIGIGQRGSDQLVDNIVIHTLTAAYHWNGSDQTVITGTWATSTEDQPVRFTTFRSGTTIWLARINAANAIDKWDGSGSAFQNVSAAPAGRDVTSTQEHVIVARPSEMGVQWSDQNDIDTWPSANIAFLTDTPGDVVAVESIGPLSFAVYKEDAVFLATRQAALTAYKFQFIALTSGPVSAAAVVAFPWGHIWLGKDNVFYIFDGSRVRPMDGSRGLVATLGTNLHVTNRGRTHAMRFRRTEDQAWFIYPDASTGDLTRMVSMVIKDPLSPQGTIALNPHTLPTAISASAAWQDRTDLTIDTLDGFSTTIDGLDNTWSTINAMSNPGESVSLLGDTAGQFYQFGIAVTDDSTAIAWEFIHPHRATAGEDKRFFSDGVSSYWPVTSQALTVTAGITFSDSLSDAETEATDTLATNTDSNHHITFANKRAKWAKVRFAGASTLSDLEYRGARFYAFPLPMV